MSRVDLSNACADLGRSIEPSAIWSYEAGFYKPRLATFGVLARALRTTMEELLYGDRVLD